MGRYGELVRHPGNHSLFLAVELSIMAGVSGVPLHVHAEGPRGTGKTSVFRAVRAAMPPIRRIRGCLFNCDPAAPHCPHHRGLSPEQVAAIGDEEVPMPFLEISHAAKLGTVVGSIDLARLTDPARAEAAVLPGTLAQAHRGIVFVDEINRLAETSPELADVLLDVMGTRPGRVQIEETGLPVVEVPALVTVWAASNPDEDPGPLDEIRRQLADRFDLVVSMGRPADEDLVTAILELSDQRLRAGGPAPAASRDVPAARFDPGRFRRVEVPAQLRRAIAALYTRFSLESLRAAEAAQLAARAAAALGGRDVAGMEDLAAVAPLVLRHRMDGEAVGRALQFLAEWGGERIAGVRAVVAAPPPAGPADPRLSATGEAAGRPGAYTRGPSATTSRPAAGLATPWWLRAWRALRGELGGGTGASGWGAGPRAGRKGTEPGSGGRAGERREPGGGRGADEEARLALADAAHPAVPPAERARPLVTLAADQWVRREEDLRP